MNLGVGGLHEDGRPVEIGIGRVFALGVEPDGAGKGLGVVRGGAEIVERRGADIVGHPVGVEDLEFGRALLRRAGEGAHEARAVGAGRRRELLQELAVPAARLGGLAERPVALGEAVDHLVGGNGLLAAERRVLDPRRGVFAAVEQPVGHRETVGRYDRDSGEEKSGKRHSAPSRLSVAREKFHIPAPRQMSISSTSAS